MDWYPNDGKRYELHKGVIVEMAPFGFRRTRTYRFYYFGLTAVFNLVRYSNHNDKTSKQYSVGNNRNTAGG